MGAVAGAHHPGLAGRPGGGGWLCGFWAVFDYSWPGMPTLAPLTEQAISLAGSAGGAQADHDRLADQLAAAGDRDDLEAARQQLLARIYVRSDDFQATAALQLVNKALAKVGWQGHYSWKHRRKP